eukprot:CAMPEP_0206241308 /NCGR_PEP_ID=MMETSP0047_2-20121206/16423_1 /ASSEMBLY_ACC=CAM_ASM_000192 /TAXON_ID=195065 /ORGANISM="Chroomonas mesostigmatica_cf, Strain CCMP1168" /LENGTH=154 /DNA_ID=CAMNT_0053666189 /DNA_START=200 /DNA_END=662 /DNA_ORIENTATION=+
MATARPRRAEASAAWEIGGAPPQAPRCDPEYMHTRSRKRGPLDAGGGDGPCALLGGDGPCALLLANRAHALYSSSALAGEPPLAGESSFLGGGEGSRAWGSPCGGSRGAGSANLSWGGGTCPCHAWASQTSSGRGGAILSRHARGGGGGTGSSP